MGNDNATVIVYACRVVLTVSSRLAPKNSRKGEPEMPLLVKLAGENGIEFQFGPPG
jgi:hypothetical protein